MRKLLFALCLVSGAAQADLYAIATNQIEGIHPFTKTMPQ